MSGFRPKPKPAKGQTLALDSKAVRALHDAAKTGKGELGRFLDKNLSPRDRGYLAGLSSAAIAMDTASIPRVQPSAGGVGAVTSNVPALIASIRKALTPSQISQLHAALAALVSSGEGVAEEPNEPPMGEQRESVNGLADLRAQAQDSIPIDNFGEQPRPARSEASAKSRAEFEARVPAAAKIGAA